MELQNAVAIVTGGASGLGGACVRRFAGKGARVVIADVNSQAGEALANELGEMTRFVKTDVSSADDAQACIESARQAFGGVHILVNCAGIATAERAVGREGPQPLEHFSKVIQVNLIGTFNMARLAAATMMENDPNAEGERGVIINTASVAAFDGQIGQAAYGASKGGVVSLTLPLAREFAKFGIRVATIAPGLMDTPMLAGLPEKARQSLSEQVPFPQRLGHPDEYAHLANFIIDNTLLNGEVIRLDGAIRMAPK
ncbi:MAG: 3-hydroxyacyl-CoA dehydrogenase [Chloroflexi bacterium]|nr:3-hydroxyacyl-CoA dehydrogenase [Chloroflexota bacterium]